jgi:sulfur relay (sulfurtransferase) DsrF/TusC family protein
MGDGVYLARANQDPRTTGWTALSPALEAALGGKGPGSPRLLVDEASLNARSLRMESLLPGATVVGEQAIADALGKARWVMVY